MDNPLMRFVTEFTPYKEEQVRQYANQAIRLGQITFNTVDNEVIPTMTDQVLKGCRENKISKSTKKRYFKLEDKIKSLIQDPGLRGEAERKGRTISETDMDDRDSKLSKS